MHKYTTHTKIRIYNVNPGIYLCSKPSTIARERERAFFVLTKSLPCPMEFLFQIYIEDYNEKNLPRILPAMFFCKSKKYGLSFFLTTSSASSSNSVNLSHICSFTSVRYSNGGELSFWFPSHSLRTVITQKSFPSPWTISYVPVSPLPPPHQKKTTELSKIWGESICYQIGNWWFCFLY